MSLLWGGRAGARMVSGARAKGTDLVASCEHPRGRYQGLFRKYLEQPIEPGGPPVFRWLQEQYTVVRRIDDSHARTLAVAGFLQRLREWLVAGDPGQEFIGELRRAMARTFGPEGSYGVFVRSDTNVEDLPGFTGAGLNLTVPHVVGFDKVLRAILQVWASPFTERAYAWRQGHMEQPEQVYVSVLLLKSVPAEKSGVMVTADVATGNRQRLTVAVNEGVGGAVDGQRAEELLVDRQSGQARLLAQAGEPLKRMLRAGGGVAKTSASGREWILSREEIRTLVQMAESLPGRFPRLVDGDGEPAPADIEFGFAGGRFYLFQIRPFLESSRAGRSLHLQRLDAQQLAGSGARSVDLGTIPGEGGP
jgi:phosphoenolpyruvate synthase/pyruvate phosphate dikinase